MANKERHKMSGKRYHEASKAQLSQGVGLFFNEITLISLALFAGSFSAWRCRWNVS